MAATNTATMNSATAGAKRINVTQMTELAVLTAIIILMAFTPLGYLKTAFAEITFIVVPVAVGAVLMGWKAGAFLGLVFGLTSLAQCFGLSQFGTLMFSLYPLRTIFCCIVPRILVGIVPGLVYAKLKGIKATRAVSTPVACVLAPLTNTILYLTCMCFLMQEPLASAYGYTGKGGFVFLFWVLALVAVNAILEALSCLIIGTAITKALQHTVNRR